MRFHPPCTPRPHQAAAATMIRPAAGPLAPVALILAAIMLSSSLAGCGMQPASEGAITGPAVRSPDPGRSPGGMATGATSRPSTSPALAPAGTAGPPTQAASSDTRPDLLVLAVSAAERRLFRLDRADAVAEIATPAGRLTWVGASAGGSIAAVDGSAVVHLATRDRDDRIAWRTFTPRVLAGAPIAEPLWNGAWSPDGRRLMLLAADQSAAGSSQLVIVDPMAGIARVIEVPGGADPAPPAWLDAGRVIASRFSRTGARSLVIVGVDDGSIVDGPAGLRGLAVSGDGSTAAALAGTDPTIRSGSVAPWLVSGGSLPPAITPPAGSEVIGLALDRSGRWLAATLERGDGSATLLIARRDADSWRVVDELPVPGAAATGAIVAWLP